MTPLVKIKACNGSITLLGCLTLKMTELGFFETSETAFPTTQRNIPEDLTFQKYRCGVLELRTEQTTVFSNR